MRFLLAALTIDGPADSLLPIVAELDDRGHEVIVMTGRAHKRRIEGAGLRWLPFVQARDVDAARLGDALPGRPRLACPAQEAFDLRELYIPLVPDQVADLELRIDQLRPDALLVDAAFALAARIADERHGMPWATCGAGARTATATGLDRVRRRIAMRGVDGRYRRMCRLLGVAPVRGGVHAEPASPYLDLRAAVPVMRSVSADLVEELSGAPRVTVRTSALVLA